nr:MAG TPA: hypothetical protein [Caudoviricetes sp.]
MSVSLILIAFFISMDIKQNTTNHQDTRGNSRVSTLLKLF